MPHDNATLEQANETHDGPPCSDQPDFAIDFTIRRRKRNWEVLDPAGELVCVTLYKCGALEVVRRLRAAKFALKPSGADAQSL